MPINPPTTIHMAVHYVFSLLSGALIINWCKTLKMTAIDSVITIVLIQLTRIPSGIWSRLYGSFPPADLQLATGLDG